MKIAVFGVGAMGSVYAGLLAEAGHEVHAIDPWRAHINAINKNGLRVQGASGDRRVTTLHADTNPDSAAQCDCYVIATKSSGVGAAARAIWSVARADSLVLTIQNGLGAGERIAENMPVDNVLLGVADGFGATMRAPGHVFHSAMKLIRLGEMQGGLTPRLDALVALWSGAGFKAKAFADIHQLIWEKYICNVTFSAPCTVFDCTVGELMADATAWCIAKGCAAEGYALARRMGVALSFSDPVVYVTEFGAGMPDARPSMWLDHHAARPSEIDAINGMAVELGRKLDIPVPYNETLSAIVRWREAKFPKTSVRE